MGVSLLHSSSLNATAEQAGDDGGAGARAGDDVSAPPSPQSAHPPAAAYKRRQTQTTSPIQATIVSHEASSASSILLRPIQASTP
jgi:hypothetical protein